MYLLRPTRLVCMGGLTSGAVLLMLAWVSRDFAPRAFCLVLGSALTLAGTPWLLSLVLRVERRPQRDVLRQDLGFRRLIEVNGVQFAAWLTPDEIHPPSYGLFVLVLQNAHDRPRRVSARVTIAPFRVVRSGADLTLRGGEVRLLTVPFECLKASPGGVQVQFELKADAPDGTGARVLEREGTPGNHLLRPYYHALGRVGSPGSGETACAHLKDRTRDFVLYQPGMAEPDLVPARNLS